VATLHELRKQSFEIRHEHFELAKARRNGLRPNRKRAETDVANKADSEIRFAKNAFSSPQKNAPEPPQSTAKPAT